MTCQLQPIYCIDLGYVFVGEPKKKLKTEGPVQYKFSQNTLLQHCKSVHGSIDGSNIIYSFVIHYDF